MRIFLAFATENDAMIIYHFRPFKYKCLLVSVFHINFLQIIDHDVVDVYLSIKTNSLHFNIGIQLPSTSPQYQPLPLLLFHVTTEIIIISNLLSNKIIIREFTSCLEVVYSIILGKLGFSGRISVPTLRHQILNHHASSLLSLSLKKKET